MQVMKGSLPQRAFRLVLEWAAVHEEELAENWRLREQRRPLKPIEPLEWPMLKEIPEVTDVTVIPPYSLDVRFRDGFCRRIDMTEELWGEVFEPLKDPEYFAKAFVDRVSGSVAWPNGADLAPEWLNEPDPEKYRKLVDGDV